MRQLNSALTLTASRPNFRVTAQLAGAEEVAYTERNETGPPQMQEALQRIADPNDPVFKRVHQLRAQNGADFVHLIIKKFPGSGICGLGYMLRDPSRPNPSRAFSVSDRECAVGNFSFVHELGHNLGMDHDRAVVGDAGSGFNYGYILPTHGMRSLMGYQDGCSTQNKRCDRQLAFSSPNLKLADGTPFGRNMTDTQAAYNMEVLCRAATALTRPLTTSATKK
jgi:hypothetical protein